MASSTAYTPLLNYADSHAVLPSKEFVFNFSVNVIQSRNIIAAYIELNIGHDISPLAQERTIIASAVFSYLLCDWEFNEYLHFHCAIKK